MILASLLKDRRPPACALPLDRALVSVGREWWDAHMGSVAQEEAGRRPMCRRRVEVLRTTYYTSGRNSRWCLERGETRGKRANNAILKNAVVDQRGKRAQWASKMRVIKLRKKRAKNS